MRRTSVAGTATALIVFLVAVGGGVSYALWNSSASTSAEVKAATVALALDDSAAEPLSGEFSPGTTLTAPVTVTNTGTVSLDYTAAVVASTPADGLASASVDIFIWPMASESDCQSTTIAPLDAWSGTFAGLYSAPSEVLSAGASQVFCVRTALNVNTDVQGATAVAELVFTGSNGWQSTATLSMNPAADIVPDPALLPAEEGCNDAGDNSQKTIELNWEAVAGASSYRLSFYPEGQVGEVVVTEGTTTDITGANFNTVAGTTANDGVGTVTISAVVNGWESAGLAKTVYFEASSSGKNAKIACTPEELKM